jgi:hypothetical protein
VCQIPVYRARIPRGTSAFPPTAVKVEHATFRVLLPLLPQGLRALTQSRHFMSRLTAAQPVPQAIRPAAAGAGNKASDAAAPPARKARRNAPKQKRKSEKGVTSKGKRTRAKKPRKIPSVHMDHPDWPWPLHYWELRHPVWWQQREYRERRIFYRSIGKTGPSEETRAQVRKWKAENGY